MSRIIFGVLQEWFPLRLAAALDHSLTVSVFAASLQWLHKATLVSIALVWLLTTVLLLLRLATVLLLRQCHNPSKLGDSGNFIPGDSAEVGSWNLQQETDSAWWRPSPDERHLQVTNDSSGEDNSDAEGSDEAKIPYDDCQ